MIKSLRRQLWTCPRCLRQQRRHGTTVAATSTSSEEAISFGPVARDSPEASHDDKILRKIFDSPSFWRDFSQRSNRNYASDSTGLFQNRYLTKPEGFQTFAQVTLQKCQRLVAKVLAASSVDDYKRIARNLDRLSDLLCRVIDLSDFVRSTHPDRRIQAAASQAYAMMFEYMNKLNTTTGLNEQLKTALSMQEVVSSWTEEERVVANILAKDFSKSAIDLPEGVRQRFVEISNDIAEMGTDFVNDMAPAKEQISLESSRLAGMDPNLVRKMTRWGTVTLPTTGTAAQMALRSVEDPDTRREIYTANRTASKRSIRQLETLLTSRSDLAKLAGYDTFGHMTLVDKMAKTPEAVNQFLRALAADNQTTVNDEMQELLEVKKADAHSENFSREITAWDREYYTARLLSSLYTRIRSPDTLSNYFSLGTVMQGLSRLFHRLYGVRLVPREAQPGETWNDDVRRLDVIDERSGHIAVVYCDLFARPGKNPNPAHFTLRCSRQISEIEVAEYRDSNMYHPFDTAVEAATDGMAHAIDPSDGLLYQLPTIALICDFARPPNHTSSSSSPRPTLLSYREVQTLFHEMGHAIHSILGRTQLQNVSGTRCATDFAELPSVLMEHFAFDPAVLQLWARHWDSDAPIPYQLIRERRAIDMRMQGAETEAQILLAMLDQAYHSGLAAAKGFDSTRTYHDIWNTHSSVPEPAGTAWQGFFGHLFGYGATYYSYLFDRAIAGKIWCDVFQRTKDGAVDRRQGERFREEVLRWGGGRDGWRCIAGVLGEKYAWMGEGGEEAMEEVGRWGVRD
ncbi:zincin [Rhizodiscina lignyota]|uniref:Mitochondrial intermediate peptidase n=1 Tax=Rhizodiscina lignyota TaxID=1504668 RepID=A0A9P4M3A4_9PEZI|nr:zincin [Rhizodiscina lignyota]